MYACTQIVDLSTEQLAIPIVVCLLLPEVIWIAIIAAIAMVTWYPLGDLLVVNYDHHCSVPHSRGWNILATLLSNSNINLPYMQSSKNATIWPIPE